MSSFLIRSSYRPSSDVITYLQEEKYEFKFLDNIQSSGEVADLIKKVNIIWLDGA